MTNRAELQGKPIQDLRDIASAIGVESEGLQKAKLIDAILSADGFKATEGGIETMELPVVAASRPSDDTGAETVTEETVADEAAPEEEAVTTDKAVTTDEAATTEEAVGTEEDTATGEGTDDTAESGGTTDTATREKTVPQRGERDEGRQEGRPDGQARKRRRRRPGGQPEQQIPEGELEVRQGILDILPEGYGFLRVTGYLPGERDVYVSASQIRKFGLRRGDLIQGPIRPPRTQEKFPALMRIDDVNGMSIDQGMRRPKFEDLTPLFPDQRLRLEVDDQPERVLVRIMDLIAPIGKGQRGLIVSPPKAGKTTVLKEIAHSVTTNNPECYLMVVLVDERPEEVTDMQRSVKGEVIYSTFDRPAEEHTQVSELALERAKRLVEMGTDVVILLDSITRLARAHNLATPASGRILSGGVDSTALYPPKRFFGAARNIEEGGSLTILGTALVETGSKMDEVIFEEFKGTGNMELRLDRRLADKRIYPALDIEASGTRKEELLFDKNELVQVWRLRRVLLALESGAALELLIDRLKERSSNAEFLAEVAKSAT